MSRGGGCSSRGGATGRGSPAIELRPFRFKFAQHSPTTRSFVEKTAKKAFMLSNRVELSSAEARVEELKGGSVGVLQLIHPDRARHTHRTQISRPEAHGIPWLEQKISNHGYPIR